MKEAFAALREEAGEEGAEKIDYFEERALAVVFAEN